MKLLIVLVGPTASGKTGTAISLAQRLGCEIISADSRQIFAEMNIGTAKPTTEELGKVKHHLVGHVSIEESYSAGAYAREARTWIEDCFSRKNVVILCGGTGLYIKALLEGLDRKPVSEEIRNQVKSIWESEGISGIKKSLLEVGENPETQMEGENPQRMMRLLEWNLAGKPIENKVGWPEDWTVLKIGLDLPREELYNRINHRVDEMIEAGLWEEALSLYSKRHLNALQTVGYQEIFDFLEGRLTKPQAIDRIKQHTRNYAKRQLTWFRKDPEITWFSPFNQAEIEAFVLAFSQGA